MSSFVLKKNFQIQKWVNSKNLSLYQMTCDILDTNDNAIDDYLRKKLNFKNRRVYFDEQ